MGKATKAAGNIYCIARLSAAVCNDTFGSREGAAEITGIDRTRLARIELGTVTAHPDEVRMLADAYNEPALLTYYCAHDCQIGSCMSALLPSAQASSLEQLAVQAAIALRNSEGIRDQLLDICADGIIDPAERVTLDRLLTQLGKITKIAMQLQALARRLHAKEGECLE